MGEIREFTCAYLDETGLTQELADSLELVFPDAYLHAGSMFKIALAVKMRSGADCCILPFCQTVEAESMGGKVNYGDAVVGPRASSYICETVGGLLELPDIDFSGGRISEVLNACRLLRRQGEDVVMKMTGPFTILNTLMDARYVFRALKKQPGEMKQVFAYIERNLISFAGEALKHGASILSYADPAGGVSIIGPKMAEEIVRDFTFPFMKTIENIIGGKAIMALCPKTTYALIDTGYAKWGALDMGGVMTYPAACVEAAGKAIFVGETCIKNGSYKLAGGILKTVNLK
jgi:uroporphyrinogen-III decarboxylase